MSTSLDHFERIARYVSTFVEPAYVSVEQEELHPFETRNIHPDLPRKVRRLFDDGYWELSVFEAFKFIEKEVKRISGVRKKTGHPLMMDVFNESSPKVKINNLATDSDVDEQIGFKHIFAGATSGIRNPRGHEVDIVDTPDEALDYLALASLLLRRLDRAGLR